MDGSVVLNIVDVVIGSVEYGYSYVGKGPDAAADVAASSDWL